MAKTAIMIDEMPNNCEECIAFAYLGYGSKKWCDAMHKELPDDCDERKPEWCRAKGIPEKLIMDDYDEHIPKDYKKLSDYEDAEENGKLKWTGMKTIDKRNKTIADHYGSLHQLIKLTEEMGELQQAVAKSIMYAMDTEKISQSEDHSEVLTELADVKIMLEQTQYIYGITDEELTNEINFKLNRQIERIENE